MRLGEYMAKIIQEGKQADPNELQQIMQQQAEDWGYKDVIVKVEGATNNDKQNESKDIESTSLSQVSVGQFESLVSTWIAAYRVTLPTRKQQKARHAELLSWDKCNGNELEREAKLQALLRLLNKAV